MREVACVNGQFMPLAEACISVNDRGFLFGDSVYEVARTYEGRVWALDRHLERLRRSLEGIQIEGVDLNAVRANMLEAYQRSGFDNAVIYVQITRGAGPRSHVPDGPMKPTILITVRLCKGAREEQVRNGVEVILVDETRWARRDIKTTNLLPNILALQQAHARGAHEAVFVTDDGWVHEASHSNLFIVSGGVVRTPPKGPALLPGITRDLVLECARRAGIPAEELPVSREALLSADEVFLTGTSSEVLGVVRIDGQPVASGTVGPITRRLHALYQDRVAAGDDA
ncbi:MAG: D-amino acid aminotransferase [Armatimonadetes bacterium]|nr:D-amino acid aminotransferase [Armatimonadota bacterium]HOQ30373.1 D-amino acid aminotransferase [Armatimonadota bacterium]